MKRLIVNADDFGFTRGVNTAIITAYQTGILSSTTLMANGDEFEHAVTLARENPGLGVGCHLAVVGGKPVSPSGSVPSLVDAEGRLPRTLSELTLKMARGAVDSADIDREFQAQIERARSSGIHPTHVDTHKHTHMHPKVMGALAKALKATAISRIRNPFETLGRSLVGPAATGNRRTYWKQTAVAMAASTVAPWFRRQAAAAGLRMPDHFRGVGITGLMDSVSLIQMLKELRDGTTEIMCHPGLYDEELESAPTRLKRQRERELAALTDPSVREILNREGITLITYEQL